MLTTPATCVAVHSDTIRNTTLNFHWFEHTDDRLTEHGQQCPYVRPERREIQLIKRLQQFVPDALPVVRKASWHCRQCHHDYYGEVLHTARPEDSVFPDNSGGNMRILNCYMANDSKGHFVTAKEAAKHNRQVLCPAWMPVNTSAGNDGQPPWFEHDQMTVAEKILLRCGLTGKRKGPSFASAGHDGSRLYGEGESGFV